MHKTPQTSQLLVFINVSRMHPLASYETYELPLAHDDIQEKLERKDIITRRGGYNQALKEWV